MDRGSKISIAASIMLAGATLALIARRNAADTPRPDLLAAAHRFLRQATGYSPPSVPQRIEQSRVAPPPRAAERVAPPSSTAPPPALPAAAPAAESPGPLPTQRQPVVESRLPIVAHGPPVTVAQPSPSPIVTALVAPPVSLPSVAPVASRPLGRTIRHRIADGDTLARLAHRYLGSPDRQAEILEANREVLSQPDLLPIGAVLKIPVPDDTGL